MSFGESRFERIHSQFSGLVFSFLRRTLGNTEDAEDASVEVFRRVHNALLGPKQLDAEKAWVMKIAVNVAIRARAQALARPHSSTLEGPTEELPSIGPSVEDEAVDRRLVETILLRLPMPQREAVWLRVGMQFTDAEVGRILGVPEGTVKAWVWRSMAKLRRELAESLPEEMVAR